MRFLLLTFLSVLVSCGQDSSSSNSKQNQEDNGNNPTLTEYATDVKQVDLLDVAMDVPVEISGNKIIFKQSMTNSANGLQGTTCSVGVTAGETYSYQINGKTMDLVTSTGRMTFERVSGEGNNIVGSWRGKSTSGSQLILRRITFLTENRLVMRTHCEG